MASEGANIENQEGRAEIERLGVLGGTFDPPHYGHLLLADTARVQLGLDRVLFAPAGQPPHKRKTQPSSAAHRVALVKAALADADEPAFSLSRVDLDRSGPHYTVDALAILSQTFPGAEIWFLIGADSLVDLAQWRTPDRILAMARLGVLPRPGYAPDVDDLASRLLQTDGSLTAADLRQRTDWLMGPALAISSSELRARTRQGLPLRFLVPPSVERYVHEQRLYEAQRGLRSEANE